MKTTVGEIFMYVTMGVVIIFFIKLYLDQYHKKEEGEGDPQNTQAKRTSIMWLFSPFIMLILPVLAGWLIIKITGSDTAGNITSGIFGGINAILLFMMIMGTLKIHKSTGMYKIINWGGDICDEILGSGIPELTNKPIDLVNFDLRYPAWEQIPIAVIGEEKVWGAPGDPIPTDPNATGVKIYVDIRSPMQKWLNRHGLHFFGLWPFRKVEMQTFEKTKFLDTKSAFIQGTGMAISFQNPEMEGCIISGKEKQNYIPWLWEGAVAVYGAEVGGFKDEEGENQLIPIVVTEDMMLQTTNILRVTTFTTNAQDAFRRNAQSFTRDLVGGKDIDWVEKSQHQAEDAEFKITMMKMNGDYGSNKGTIQNFGFKIANKGTIFFKDWGPDGEDAKKMIEARQKVYIAEQQAKVDKKTGEGLGDKYAEETNRKTAADQAREDKLGEIAAKNRKRLKDAGADPNVEIAYQNIGKLSETKGTVIIGNGGVMPTIPLENKEGGSK